MTQRSVSDAFIHIIPENIVKANPGDVELDEYFQKAMSYLLETKADLKRGDIVLLESISGYRNDGKCIFNGEILENLYQEIDDYGSVPPEYKVIDEFPVGYWANSIDHNNIVWFDPTQYELNIKEHPDGYSVASFEASDGQIYEILAVNLEQISEMSPSSYFYCDLDYGVWDDEEFINLVPQQNGRRLYLPN